MNGYSLVQRLEKIMTDAEPKGYDHVDYGIKYKVWDHVAQPLVERHRRCVEDAMSVKIYTNISLREHITRNIK